MTKKRGLPETSPKNPGRAKKSETGPTPGGNRKKPVTAQTPVDTASTGVYINL